MKPSTLTRLFATTALLASSSYASPIAHQSQLIDLSSRQVGAVDPGTLIRAGLDAVKNIDEFSRIQSADFSLDRSWKDEVLFDGEFQGANGPTGMQVTCLDCHTAGTVSVDIWEDIFRPSLEFKFQDTSAYVLMGVNISAGENVAINLFSSQSPIGVGIPGLSVGVYFAIDLIFSLSANMVLSGGFFVDFPESASLELGIFDGQLDDSSLDGTKSGILPVTVHSAHGKFKADLRISIQAGVETDNPIFGIGAGAMLGVYANVVELIATLDSTPTCAMELEAEYNLNVGAYAKLSIDIGPSVIGATPTASTTLLSAPIITTCLNAAQTSGPISQPPALSATLTSISSSAVSASVPASDSVAVSDSMTVSSPITVSATDSVTATPSTPSSISYIASSASISAKLDITSSSASTSETTTSAASYPTITPPVNGKPHCLSSAKAAAKLAAKARKAQRSPAQVYTITRCDVDAVNCPEGHAKQVVATSRPAVLGVNSRVAGTNQWADIVVDGVVPIGEAVMTRLAEPIVNSVVF